MGTAGEVIVESLVANGVDRVFCVPGESYLGLLDALYGRNEIDTVVCRHESGAGFMALADARLTGRPGVACVSRGPGTANATIAVHTAQQDATPLILLVGQVPVRDLRRDSFQEIDYRKMFGGIAKWVTEVVDPDRMAETMLRAFQVASTGVPGPVVVVVPEDVLTSVAKSPAAPGRTRLRGAPHPDDVATLRTLLAEAKRPLVLAGSGLEPDGGREALLRLVEAWRLPVVVGFRRQDLFPNAHPHYAGDMGLSNPPSQMALLDQADLLVVLGARLTDITTQGYTWPEMVRPQMRLVHIHADPYAIGTHFTADLGVVCEPRALIEALGAPEATPAGDREDWIAGLRREHDKTIVPRQFAVEDGVPFEAVVHRVGQHLPPDAIVTVDAGAFGGPVYRMIPFAPPQRMLAPLAGAMGYGVPAAVASSLRHPDRLVVCFVGDGGFLMTGNELAVAKERNLPLKVIVSENGVYGSILIHQAREYPGRYSGTSFVNPDLDQVGRAYGCETVRIGSLEELDRLPAILARPGPQLVVVDTSVAAVLPKPRAVAAAGGA